MQLINVINLEKYQPGYKDRKMIWIKVYFSLINGSYEFEMLHEIDKWRFVALCMLQSQTRKPVPADSDYLKTKGWKIQNRKLSLTIKFLSDAQLIEVVDVTEKYSKDKKSVTIRNETVTQNRLEESRLDNKDKNRIEGEGEATPTISFGSHVRLTQPQHDELSKGSSSATVDEYIDRINDYCSAQGKTYKDWSAVIRTWIRRDRDEGKFKLKSDGLAKMERLMNK